jgi:membrane protein required for colicin V production
MCAFNWIDIVIAAVVLVSALIGFLRGFAKEALSLIVWAAAFMIGFKFYVPLSHNFASHITNEVLRLAIAFIILFGVVLVLGSILTHLITNLITKSGINGPDRALGMIFGLARGILLIAVMLLLFSMGLKEKEKSSWQLGSYLIPKFDYVVKWLGAFLPGDTGNGGVAEKIKADK